MTEKAAPLRIGIGGPVGSGKTALLEVVCKAMRDDYNLAVVTNDIYTKEDAKILTQAEAKGLATSMFALRSEARQVLKIMDDMSGVLPKALSADVEAAAVTEAQGR